MPNPVLWSCQHSERFLNYIYKFFLMTLVGFVPWKNKKTNTDVEGTVIYNIMPTGTTRAIFWHTYTELCFKNKIIELAKYRINQLDNCFFSLI